jgi:hypothetical protein
MKLIKCNCWYVKLNKLYKLFTSILAHIITCESLSNSTHLIPDRKTLDLSLNTQLIVYCLVLSSALKTLSSFKWLVRILIIWTPRRFISYFQKLQATTPEISVGSDRRRVWRRRHKGVCSTETQHVRDVTSIKYACLKSARHWIKKKLKKNYYLHCMSLDITPWCFSTVFSEYRVFKHGYTALKSGITNCNVKLKLNSVITASVCGTPRL